MESDESRSQKNLIMITVVCKKDECGVGLQQQGGIKCISLPLLAFEPRNTKTRAGIRPRQPLSPCQLVGYADHSSVNNA